MDNSPPKKTKKGKYSRVSPDMEKYLLKVWQIAYEKGKIFLTFQSLSEAVRTRMQLYQVRSYMREHPHLYRDILGKAESCCIKLNDKVMTIEQGAIPEAIKTLVEFEPYLDGRGEAPPDVDMAERRDRQEIDDSQERFLERLRREGYRGEED